MEKALLSFPIYEGNRKVIKFITNIVVHTFYFKMVFEEKYPQC